jgi:3-hydroxyacyl-[acyl-carrier-protein] dehydratase
VPSKLLFDISGIDTNAVAISADEVGRLIPQCGHMRQLDHVAWIGENSSQLLGVKQVRDDEFWVPGHIPGRPLLPGVLMIEAAAQLCSIMYRLKTSGTDVFLGFTRCTDVAFRGQVTPGQTLYVLATERTYRPRRIVSDTQSVVEGNLVFEARISGMEM